MVIIGMKKSLIKDFKAAMEKLGNMKDYATDSVTLAVSISDRRHRADVKFIRAVSFKRAWEPIEGLLAKAPQNIWIRIEVIHSVQRKRRAQLERILHEMTRMNYWRQGVSFDADFKTALLEMCR